MQTIGNTLWLVLAGFWLATGYVITGMLAFVLIVTIPLRHRFPPLGEFRPLAIRPNDDLATRRGHVVSGRQCRVDHLLRLGTGPDAPRGTGLTLPAGCADLAAAGTYPD